jgi:wobble nucleotide-excising tRNase
VPDRVEITCPCCGTHLTVDAATSEILAEQRPKLDPAKTFDAAMEEVRTSGQRRSDAFSKAFDRTQHLPSLLEKKFEEAKKKAARDPKDKPRNPFDVE